MSEHAPILVPSLKVQDAADALAGGNYAELGRILHVRRSAVCGFGSHLPPLRAYQLLSVPKFARKLKPKVKMVEFVPANRAS